MLGQNRLEIKESIQRAEAFRLDEIAARYAEEAQLSPAQIEEQIRELKRYLVLVAVTGEPFLMGGPVDRLWHTWMLFSRSYTDFCASIAGRYIHHAPGRDKALERAQEHAQWAAFRRSYEALYGETPPAHIWPGAHQQAVGSRGWWLERLERYSRGGKLQACLIVGCDGTDDDRGTTTTSSDDAADITICAPDR